MVCCVGINTSALVVPKVPKYVVQYTNVDIKTYIYSVYNSRVKIHSKLISTLNSNLLKSFLFQTIETVYFIYQYLMNPNFIYSKLNYILCKGHLEDIVRGHNQYAIYIHYLRSYIFPNNTFA